MRKFDLNDKYNRNKFLDFLSDFMPEDFSRNVEELHYQGNRHIDDNGQYVLGKSDSLDLVVFEFVFNGERDPRVSITKEAMKLMQSELHPNALVVFHNPDYDFWRLSLITTDYTYDEKDNAKIILSNPKRFSFLLGAGCKKHTPEQFLFSKGRVGDLDDLKDRFSIDVVTKDFYNSLFKWYDEWAVKLSLFPEGKGSNVRLSKDNNNLNIIRLITRLMFVWFIKQKSLVPSWIFDIKELKEILVDFDEKSEEDGNYYNAILQNLFFATLNNEISSRGFAEESEKGKVSNSYGVKTLFRDNNKKSFFLISRVEFVKSFECVPYLNGGLFECLDRDETRESDGKTTTEYVDGFSREKERRAFVPNALFFGNGDKEGIIQLFERYNFTVEENTPSEVEVALDPELLGKVFENLLGTYNPETKESARNSTGSFYTPREIVAYMIDESLKHYLKQQEVKLSDEQIEILFDDAKDELGEDFDNDLCKQIKDKILSCRCADIACGSGAFPMGFLNRMVGIIKKVDRNVNVYEIKLEIIKNCIYGVDIQSIAVQISKLRFFISLICEEEKNDNKQDNYGIMTLPNLETKFVAANSLISLKSNNNDSQDLFDNTSKIRNKLIDIRRKHFSAKSMKEKRELRKEDKKCRDELLKRLTNGGLSKTEAEYLANWDPYNQNESAGFFDLWWMFGLDRSFDIVIGNPPYIQLQNAISGTDKNYGDLYAGMGYKTFARRGDIYCLFYEKGMEILKNKGCLCYITSNKWMRAEYGSGLRNLFANYRRGNGKGAVSVNGEIRHPNPDANLLSLVDLGGGVFEGATVDTEITLVEKAKAQGKTMAVSVNRSNKGVDFNLLKYVNQNSTQMAFEDDSIFTILNPIEKSIKEKIEKYGTPLKDWDISINYGIKTGLNEAFIINEAKRTEILNACKDDDERKRTAELIRPILRGKDIKRYSYEWAGLYVILAYYGSYKVIPIQYPAIFEHLKKYENELKSRGQCRYTSSGRINQNADYPGQHHWLELDNNPTLEKLDDFNKPKIVYPCIMNQEAKYAFDLKGILFVIAPGNIITSEKYNVNLLCKVLCSKIYYYYVLRKFYMGGGIDGEIKTNNLLNLPIPKELIIQLNNCTSDKHINNVIAKFIGLTNNELELIEKTNF